MTEEIRIYSTEFIAEVVKKIADNNGNVSATAKQLGIAIQTETSSTIRYEIIG